MTASDGNCIRGIFSTFPVLITSMKRGIGLNMKMKLHVLRKKEGEKI